MANPACGRDVRRLVTGASVVERSRFRGDAEATGRAERELPEKVDPDRDAELLRRFDVDPSALVAGFSGQSPEVG